METPSGVLTLLFATLVFAGFASALDSDLYEVDVRQLADIWARERVSPPDPGSLTHAALKRRIEVLRSSTVFRVERIGQSVEARDIFLVTVGDGEERVLFWSQMHGDEATATGSLLDLFEFFRRHHGEPWVSRILRKYTLMFIPMLNPDGAERNQRRNAQGLDINRDARALQSAEGRLLKQITERYQPFLAFNLHNQNSRTTVGDTGKVATIALLAVAADRQGPVPDAPPIARQIAAVLYESLSPFVYGHISRYDELYNPRAFGDNITMCGTPVVLIESGGIPTGSPPDLTVQLNYVGILAVLDSLASGRIGRANPAVYDALKMNSLDPIFDLILRDAWVFNGTGVPPFRGDVAVRSDARGGTAEAIVADVGDLGVFSAHQYIDCAGALLTPGLIDLRPGRSSRDSTDEDREALRRGITTILETTRLAEIRLGSPAFDWDAGGSRALNWGFVVAGGQSGDGAAADLLLAESFAAGARGWINERGEEGPARIPRWFGFKGLAASEAARHSVPKELQGRPESVFPRFTSEAASRFRLGRRGTISIGSVADLVVWRRASGGPPDNVADFKPALIILNGHVCDPSSPEVTNYGRFIGR